MASIKLKIQHHLRPADIHRAGDCYGRVLLAHELGIVGWPGYRRTEPPSNRMHPIKAKGIFPEPLPLLPGCSVSRHNCSIS